MSLNENGEGEGGTRDVVLFSGQTVWGNWKVKEDPFLFTSVCVGWFHLPGILTLLPNAGAPVVRRFERKDAFGCCVSRVWWCGGECGKFAKHGEAFAVSPHVVTVLINVFLSSSCVLPLPCVLPFG